MSNKEMIKETLEGLGFKPMEDKVGSIFILHEMKTIYILVPEDECFVTAVLPKFHDIGEEEKVKCLAACNNVTREAKLVKVYIEPTAKEVSASCEFFYCDKESLSASLGHSIEILGMVRTVFYNAMKELEEREKVEDTEQQV